MRAIITYNIYNDLDLVSKKTIEIINLEIDVVNDINFSFVEAVKKQDPKTEDYDIIIENLWVLY
jgi:hypothetical protein